MSSGQSELIESELLNIKNEIKQQTEQLKLQISMLKEETLHANEQRLQTQIQLEQAKSEYRNRALEEDLRNLQMYSSMNPNSASKSLLIPMDYPTHNSGFSSFSNATVGKS